MGHPKFPSKHYDTPSHPWQKVRIEEESGLIHQYGLKNKREIWRANTKVREMRRQARKLTANSSDEQAQKEKNLLLAKLNRLGMLEQNSGLEDVLTMTPESVLRPALLRTWASSRGDEEDWLQQNSVHLDLNRLW